MLAQDPPAGVKVSNYDGLFTPPLAGANRRWRCQFRYRGSRRRSAVAQLFSLGGMRPFATFLALAAVVLLSGGCSRTYISTGDPGVPSPDGDTRLCLTAHGAYGRSYTDRTR